MKVSNFWTVAAVAIGLTSLAQSALAEPSDLITYRCDENKGFTAVYTLTEANNRVELTFGTKVITLPQIESASGARYSDGSVTLFTKGDEAFVTVGENRLFVNCVASGGIQGLW